MRARNAIKKRAKEKSLRPSPSLPLSSPSALSLAREIGTFAHQTESCATRSCDIRRMEEKKNDQSARDERERVARDKAVRPEGRTHARGAIFISTLAAAPKEDEGYTEDREGAAGRWLRVAIARERARERVGRGWGASELGEGVATGNANELHERRQIGHPALRTHTHAYTRATLCPRETWLYDINTSLRERERDVWEPQFRRREPHRKRRKTPRIITCG